MLDRNLDTPLWAALIPAEWLEQSTYDLNCTSSIVVLPFADLVLLTATSSLAIVFGVLLAIFMLEEVFVCRYDMTALILIMVGCILTIAQSNFQEHIYTADDV